MIERSVSKKKLSDKSNDREYWLTQSVQARMDHLEQLRTEYILWKYGSYPGLQRVYSIIKRKIR
ncbi:MAG: hypothetical protein EDM75_14765 [Chlorobiota bacterium]|nr:MAG: hypothetical protein EDM75_14765 [Chlorobiota bacterium]